MQNNEPSAFAPKVSNDVMLKSKSSETLKSNIITIHQLDCIYYGEINKSYNKEGFGILQTIDFQTYFGFWKNGRAEGIGLLIYPSGQIIYGKFLKNLLNGVGIIDNGLLLKIGIFQGIHHIGICCEYSYPTKTWNMIKYNNKGLPIGSIKEEVLGIEDGIPAMIAAEHSIYKYFRNYIQGNFFGIDEYQQVKPKKQNKKSNKDEDKESKYSKLNQMLVKNDQDSYIIGFRQQNKINGIGCTIDKTKKKLIESAFYKNGKIHGYALANNDDFLTIGPYVEGYKQGIFLQFRDKISSTSQYRQNLYVGPGQLTEQQIKKRQMKYNFEQKDFLSSKNMLQTVKMLTIFEPAETRLYKMKRDKQLHQQDSLQHSDNKGQAQQSPLRDTSLKKTRFLDKNKIAHSYIPEKNEKKLEKSCITIMREKIDRFDVLGIENSARKNSLQKQKEVLNSKLKIYTQDEESIALEQNPFDNVVNGYNTLNSSSRKRQ